MTKVLQKCVNCGNKQEVCVSYLSYKDEQNEMTCKECNLHLGPGDLKDDQD